MKCEVKTGGGEETFSLAYLPSMGWGIFVSTAGLETPSAGDPVFRLGEAFWFPRTNSWNLRDPAQDSTKLPTWRKPREGEEILLKF